MARPWGLWSVAQSLPGGKSLVVYLGACSWVQQHSVSDPSVVSQCTLNKLVTEHGEQWLLHTVHVLPWRGPEQTGELRCQESCEVPQTNWQVWALGTNSPMHHHYVPGANQAESSCVCKDGLWGAGGQKLTTSQKLTFMAEEASSCLGWI